MHLINGQSGIGTGSSTWIPAHNPLDIVYWLECKIKGLPLPELIPWYRGFKGEIELRKRGQNDKEKEEKEDKDETSKNSEEKESNENNEELHEEKESEDNLDEENEEKESNEEKEDPDEVMIDKKTKISMITSGCFDDSDKKRVTVTVANWKVSSLHQPISGLSKPDSPAVRPAPRSTCRTCTKNRLLRLMKPYEHYMAFPV